jgi:hypothetical protein
MLLFPSTAGRMNARMPSRALPLGARFPEALGANCRPAHASTWRSRSLTLERGRASA